jgi:hypothetical protein
MDKSGMSALSPDGFVPIFILEPFRHLVSYPELATRGISP